MNQIIEHVYTLDREQLAQVIAGTLAELVPYLEGIKREIVERDPSLISYETVEAMGAYAMLDTAILKWRSDEIGDLSEETAN